MSFPRPVIKIHRNMHFPWTPLKLVNLKSFLKTPHQSVHCGVPQKIAKIVMLKINYINLM